MRRFLLALVLSQLPTTSWATNPMCPTRPFGDSTNACASTAFTTTGIATNFASPPPLGNITPNAVFSTSFSSTGPATVPTKPITDNSTNIATTAFVFSQLTRVSVLDYGADPTGVADSCGTVLTNALAAIPAAGGTLYWPRGSYLCNGQIAVSNKPIATRGDGPGISNINFPNATTGAAGIAISQNAAQYTTFISDLSIVTTVAQPTNAGVSVTYTIAPNIDRTVTISNVDINGGIANTNYWHNAISCVGCGYGVIDNFHIKGKNESNPSGGISASNMFAGINLSTKSTDMRITKGSVVFSYYGAYISGDSESQQFDDTTMLGTNWGWYNDDFLGSGDSASLGGAPGPRIYNSHCAAYFGCVSLKGWSQSIIQGNLLYKRPESTTNFNAITLTQGSYQGPTIVGTNFTAVNGNTFIGFYAGGSLSTGLYFDPVYAAGNNIVGNIVDSLSYFANFNSGAVFNTVSDNMAYVGFLTAWFINPSTGTVANNNIPINAGSDTGTVVFAANATAPNVGGYVVSSFLTANSGATTVTNFLNGYVGQIITVVANDANTTIQNNAGMILHGGVNYVMAAGNTLTLKREQSTYWREIGRS